LAILAIENKEISTGQHMAHQSHTQTKKEQNGPYVAGGIGGSAQPNASAQVLAGARSVIPHQNIAPKFAESLIPLDLRMAANPQESRILATLRDTILPKLISGKIRVKDAEKAIAEIGL
jgi:type I restriction enzyme S subunit